MKVLLDTNILLDSILERKPFDSAADRVWQANERRQISAYVTTSSLRDLVYLVRKERPIEVAFQAVRICLDTFRVCRVGRLEIERALRFPGSDFEDNLQLACALAVPLDAIITRDKKFKGAPIPVLTPAQLLSQLTRR